MRSKLRLTPDEMRELGYRAVDFLVDHFENVERSRPAAPADREALVVRLSEPIPDEGHPPLEVLDRLMSDVFPAMMHLDHPRFFAFVPSPNNFVGVIGDLLASGLDVFAGSWLASAGPAEVERTTIGWLRDACGLPAPAGGLFVSGGSVANLTALAVARKQRGAEASDAVIYCSDQTHSSIDRAVRLLGFADGQLRKLPSDERFRLDTSALRQAIARDRAEGRAPFCVVANAGTTNTGAVDPLPEIAAIAGDEGLWLHADGAYGAAAVFSDEGRALLDGLGAVDSLSLDPHKWLFQPIECGCVLVRDAAMLRETFEVLPDYLKDVKRAGEEINFRDYGIQLTRGFRALKLWMSFQVFGREAFAEAISRGMELARVAERAAASLENWHVVTPAEMALVTFRYAPPGLSDEEANAFNEQLVVDAIAEGYVFLSSTRLRGRTVLRLCTINPRTTEAEIEAVLAHLDALARRRASED